MLALPVFLLLAICMAATTARYPYGYYPYSQEQVQVRLTLSGSVIFTPSELCLLETRVPLSRLMIAVLQYM